jgi:hypothetical protein
VCVQDAQYDRFVLDVEAADEALADEWAELRRRECLSRKGHVEREIPTLASEINRGA